ncbi:Ankyrin repeat domain-containing protein 31 [Mactra antiquata]
MNSDTHKFKTRLGNITGEEMSPTVPKELQNFTQTHPDSSDSEQSEVLIPLIETPHQKTNSHKNTNTHPEMDIDGQEESQSLLPQLPVQTNGAMKCSVEECLSSSSHSQTVLDFPMLSQINVQDDPLKSKPPRHRAITYFKDQNHSQKPNMLFSQVSLSNSMTGEINADMTLSQRELTLTSAEKLSCKINNLVDSLDQVPRKQMLVTEATLLQCISYLQNNLHKQFKKNDDQNIQLGMNKQLLLTCQTGLVKVSKIHKNEKLTMNQMGTGPCVSQTKNKAIKAQAMKDLEKRQKRVLVLLKRQRCLVDLLKTVKRSSSCGSDTEKTKLPASSIETDTEKNSHRVKATDKVAKRDKVDAFNKNAIIPVMFKEYNTTMEKSGHNEPENLEKSKAEDDLKQTGNSERRKSNQMVHVTQDYNEFVADCDTSADVCMSPEYSQRNNTQNTIRTSGKDLFDDDNDNDDDYNNNVEEYAQENSQIINTQGLSQMFTCMESRGDGRTETEFTIEAGALKVSTQASIFNFDSITTVSGDGKVDSNDLQGKAIKPNFKEQQSKQEKNSNPIEEKFHKSEKSGTASNIVDNLTEIGMNNRDSYDKVQTVFNEKSRVVTSVINDVNTYDNENVASQRNKGINHLKKKVNKTNSAMGTNGEPENVSKSEILWLNMLRNDSDKMKPVKMSKMKENLKPANKFDQSEVLVARKLPMSSEAQTRYDDLKQIAWTSNPFTDNLNLGINNNFENKEMNRNRENVCYQKEPGIIDTNTRGQLPEVKEKMPKSVDELNIIDQSLQACSPISLAVRGSPCETLINLSPNGSTVCSEGFTLPTEHLDSYTQRKSFSSPYKKDNSSKLKNVTVELYNSKPVQFEKLNKTCHASEDEIPRVVCTMDGRMNDEIMRSSNKDTGDIHENVAKTDTISKAIDSVIQQSRVLNSGHQNTGDTFHKKQKQSTITSLKELVQSGVVIPGKSVLSCNIKGIHHKASVLYSGKINTVDGHTYNTVSAWLTSLDNNVVCKRRKAYEMVQYKGRSLLSCSQQIKPSNNNQPRVTQPCKVMTDSCTQVDSSVFSTQNRHMTADEKWLNNLLSKSIVQLLSNRDLVTDHDLPDNFWAEDFSKVRLSSDIWRSITAW